MLFLSQVSTWERELSGKYGMQKKVMKLNIHLMQTFNDRTFSIYFIADYHDSG